MKLSYILGLVFLAIILIVSGCDLKRTNPLDPEQNIDIVAPPQIIWDAVRPATASPANAVSKYVELKWNKSQANTTGYYLYMSMAYNSAYARVRVNPFDPASPLVVIGNETGDPTAQTITHTQSYMVPGDYYFKVSAFKDYGNDGILEGPLSDWTYVRVPN
jgi:hypothetical protein